MAERQKKKHRKKGPRPNPKKKPSKFEDSWFAALLYSFIDLIFSWRSMGPHGGREIHSLFSLTDRLSPKGKKRADAAIYIFLGIWLIAAMIGFFWMGVIKHYDDFVVVFSGCFFLMPVSTLAFVIQKWLILPMLRPRYQLYLKTCCKPYDPCARYRLDPDDRKPLLYLCFFPYYLLMGFGFTMDFSWLFLRYFMVDGPVLWAANGALILAILFEIIGFIAPKLYFFPLLHWMNPRDCKSRL